MTTLIAEARRATEDVGSLVAFRLGRLRGRARSVAAVVVVVVGLAVASAVVPAYLDGAGTSPGAVDMIVLLPTAYLALLLTTLFAAIGAGGGRELLPRDEAVSFPVSPTTDHLGALLLAPVNVAWMLQACSLLSLTAYASGPTGLWAVQVTTLAWLFFATSSAQALAWCVEGVRRGPGGPWIVKGLTVAFSLLVAGLVATGTVTAVLDESPTFDAVVAALNGRATNGRWALGTLAIVGGGLVAVATGASIAHVVARLQPRDELQSEGRQVAPRAMARSDFAALVRADRASVWRSLPLRRGFLVLALMPGLVAAAGRLEWQTLTVLPGLVAAGSALLFGVNAWALDGVGALWRDSLPVSPAVVFVARVRVLCEVLLMATALTLLVAAVRADAAPTPSEVAAVLATMVVVSLQVAARSMQWSVRHPFAMDLKSARGTPAPPLAMAGYSAYLALTATLTGVVFAVAAQVGDPRWSLVLMVPFLLVAVRRLMITCREWTAPDLRARVVATVSAL